MCVTGRDTHTKSADIHYPCDDCAEPLSDGAIKVSDAARRGPRSLMDVGGGLQRAATLAYHFEWEEDKKEPCDPDGKRTLARLRVIVPVCNLVLGTNADGVQAAVQLVGPRVGQRVCVCFLDNGRKAVRLHRPRSSLSIMVIFRCAVAAIHAAQ